MQPQCNMSGLRQPQCNMKCFGSISVKTKRSTSGLLSIWFQGTGWAKYFEVWACSAWVGRGGRRECLTRTCFHLPWSVWSSLCDSIAEGEWQSLLGRIYVDLSSFLYALVKVVGCSFLGHSEGDTMNTWQQDVASCSAIHWSFCLCRLVATVLLKLCLCHCEVASAFLGLLSLPDMK